MKYEEARILAYHALQAAATRIGLNNCRAGLYRGTYRKGKLVKGYSITGEHQELVDAMPKVLNGELSVEDAMCLLWQYDTFKQRFADANPH